MENSLDILELIMCPKCGSDIGGDFTCIECGNSYGSVMGVSVMVDPETTKKEWKWGGDVISEEVRNKIKKDYELSLSSEIKLAQDKWWQVALRKSKNISGIIVDIASGLGTMLEFLLSYTNGSIISTDVDPGILISSKKEFDMKYSSKRVEYIATDAKHVALKGDSADYITSFAGTNNIVNVSEALKEFSRVLRPDGRLFLMAGFVDKGSTSEELASQNGLKDSFVRDDFLRALADSGFQDVSIEEAASVAWNSNSMDLLPAAGDMVHYCVVEAKNTK